MAATVVDTPTKPPRGVKNAKETSGLLMTIIKTLSASESNEQRDEERTKLEKEYKKSNQQVEQLVSVHHHDLTAVMKLFSRISSLVSTSQNRVHQVKDNLIACKKLLTCRREELQRLWLEGIEYKHSLQLLQEIEQMKEIPYQLTNHLSQKHYLQATRILVSAIQLSETTLKDVSALYEIKSVLHIKKKEMNAELLKEMSEQIYIHYTREVLQLRRQSSSREYGDHISPLQRITEKRSSMRNSPHNKAKKHLNFSVATNNSRDNNLLKVENEVEFTDDPEYVIGCLVDCIILLDTLHSSLEELKARTQSELLSLVLRTSKELLPNDSNQILIEFFHIIIEQFKRIVDAYKFILLRCSSKATISSNIFNLSDIWSKIQYVMQILLTDYLDIKNLKNKMERPMNTATAFIDNFDVTALFARRKPQRFLKEKFYRFEINRELYSQVSELESYHRDKVMLCKPSPHNITLIFVSLTSFIEEIEKVTGCSPERPCMLNVFINEFVRDVFLGNHYNEVTASIDTITKATDAWRAITNTYQQIILQRPLLLSTVQVAELLNEVLDLMQTLPSHRKHFKSLIKKTLSTYKEICNSTYKGIVQPEMGSKYVKSSSWLKQNEIQSCLKMLPNWLELKSEHATSNTKKADKTQPNRIMAQENEQKHVMEADMLMRDIGNSGIAPHEIISDINRLKCLAQVQESMEWFSCRVNDIANYVQIDKDGVLPNKISSPYNSASPPLIAVHDAEQDSNSNASSNATIVTSNNNLAFKQLCNEFVELSDNCLLIMHLEVRAQCFYYLLPKNNLSASGHDKFLDDTSHDPDPKILELSRILSSLDETLSPYLQPKKVKYIFDGLGSLITKILLDWTRIIDRIDEILVHKICRNIYTLQQTLSTITGVKELSLDRAKIYFHMLFLTPQEILNEVSEKGTQFTELEYMNLLHLIHRSRSEYSEEGLLQEHLQKLSLVFGDTDYTKILYCFQLELPDAELNEKHHE